MNLKLTTYLTKIYVNLISIYFRYKNKKIFLHVASECYVPFNIAIAYKKKFVFRNIFNKFILRSQQSGLLTKIVKDIEWEIIQHSGIKKVSTFFDLKFLNNLQLG